MAEEQTIAPAKGLVELRLLARNARLREARMEKGFTQKDLSDITGISAHRIQQIENLWLIPRREVMEEISSALERPVDFLFPPELLEAIEEGVFHERKVQLEARRIISLTEAKRLGYPRLLASGIEETERKAELSLLKDQLKEVITTLTPREQNVITLRFGLDGSGTRTLDEVAYEFSVTCERIRQIEAKALRKLRHPARSKNLKDFLD